MDKIYIGMKDYEVMNSIETKKQIEYLIEKYKLDLAVVDNEEAAYFEWKHLYDSSWKEELTILNSIIKDRENRVDENIPMYSRPQFAICTVDNDKIVRFEFYQGDDQLILEYDLRSLELQSKEIQPSYKERPF